ncbi:MAG: hypothetical protein QM791_04925 [Ferruginibacter sp.]
MNMNIKKGIVYVALMAGTLSFLSCATTNGITVDDISNGRAKCGSCTGVYTPTELSADVKKETKKMLQSHIIKMAGAEMDKYTYYLVINENKTFSTIVNIHATKQYDFRAGTFKAKGDTLSLSYYKNLKSDFLTDKLVIDNKKREIYFLNKDLAQTTRLKILNEL